jgi:intein/homing endonuclease
VTLDTLIETIKTANGIDVISQIPISEVQPGTMIACGSTIAPVLKVRNGFIQEIYTITTKKGYKVSCSASHKLVKSRFDKQGTPVHHLKVGDWLLVSEEGHLDQDSIVDITIKLGETEVRTLSLPSPHLFVTNNIVSHNIKGAPPEGE